MTAEVSPARMLTIDTRTWVSSLPVTLAVFQSGTPKGHDLAKQNLQRMAEVADLATEALKIVERLASSAHVRSDDVCLVLAEARRLNGHKPCDNSSEHHAAPSPEGDTCRACGQLAKRFSNLELPLDICQCSRGYYIGTYCDDAPYTRESEEFWPLRELAMQALRRTDWTQRTAP